MKKSILSLVMVFACCGLSLEVYSQGLRHSIPIHVNIDGRVSVSYDGGLTYEAYRVYRTAPEDAVVDRQYRKPGASVYPNPTSGEITIGFSEATSGDWTLKVLNQVNAVVKEARAKGTQLRAGFKLSTDGFADGVYRLILSNETQQLTLSFVHVSQGGNR